MAHRFCFPDWSGSDGAAVTSGQTIPGTSDTWPQSGTVYTTLAATYATGGHTIWLPHGYRLPTPANGVWLNANNVIESGSGQLVIRAYAAGQGARNTADETAARARIRAAAYQFNEAQFRAGVADCWNAMCWPVIDAGYYMSAGEWTYLSTGSGGYIWRAILPWGSSLESGSPGVFLLKTGAAAPSNKVADMRWGTLRQQAFTQGDLALTPDYQASEAAGIWHGYRSDAAGVSSAGGAYTTLLFVTGGSSAAYNPVTINGGIVLIGEQIAADAIRLRNGATADIEDVCLAHMRTPVRIGRYTNSTDNGVITLTRTHLRGFAEKGYHVNSGSASVSHCGVVTLTDISYDMESNDDCTHETGSSIEPRSLASTEGVSIEQRGNDVTLVGGWALGAWHSGLAVQLDNGYSNEPHGCAISGWSAMGTAPVDRMCSFGGYDNTTDGIWAWNGGTRSQFSVDGTNPTTNEHVRMRLGPGRTNTGSPDESWSIFSVSSPITPVSPQNNGVLRFVDLLLDTSNGLHKFGMQLVCSLADSGTDFIGDNALQFLGLTLKVHSSQECALRVVHRADVTTQISLSQTFKHVRIVQESGSLVPQCGYQQNNSASNGTLQWTGALSAHFNGATTVIHKLEHGAEAVIDSGGGREPAQLAYESQAAHNLY